MRGSCGPAGAAFSARPTGKIGLAPKPPSFRLCIKLLRLGSSTCFVLANRISGPQLPSYQSQLCGGTPCNETEQCFAIRMAAANGLADAVM